MYKKLSAKFILRTLKPKQSLTIMKDNLGNELQKTDL